MKYLAIDLGNVVCRVNFDAFKKLLSKILNIGMDEAEYFLVKTQRLHDIGLTNVADELQNNFNIKSPALIEELLAEWNLTIQSEAAMIEMLDLLVHSKHTDQVKIALLSNIGPEHAGIVPGLLTWRIYDKCIKFFSYEVGARKPSYLYYKTFLDMHPEFKGCIYVDDRLENIKTGRQFGLNSVHFELDSFHSYEDLAVGIEKLKQLIYSA